MENSSTTQAESDLSLYPGAVGFIFWCLILSTGGLTYFLPLGYLTIVEQLLIGLASGLVAYYFAKNYAIQNGRKFHHWLFNQ